MQISNEQKKSNSVTVVTRSGQCIGCGACEIACQYNAIHMMFDREEGIQIPVINDERCISCGDCIEVCFGAIKDKTSIDDSYINTVEGEILSIYVGYATNEETRFDASSGGIVSVLLEYLLEEKLIDGGLVVRLNQGNPPLAITTIAKTFKDVKNYMGSKYSPVYIAEAIRHLKDGEKYAFVGTPCQIHAVKELSRKGRVKGSIEIFIGLLCGGVPNGNAVRYLAQRYGLQEGKFRYVRYRGDGWPGKMKLQIENQSIIKLNHKDYWPQISPWFNLNRCMTCVRGFNPRADISCGDYWNSKEKESGSKGTSLVFVKSSIGKDLLESAVKAGHIEVKPISKSAAYESQKGLGRNKIRKLSVRLQVLEKCGKKHTIEHTETDANFTVYVWEIIEEVLIQLGRFLASRRSLWRMFQHFLVFHHCYDNFLRMLRRITKR